MGFSSLPIREEFIQLFPEDINPFLARSRRKVIQEALSNNNWKKLKLRADSGAAHLPGTDIRQTKTRPHWPGLSSFTSGAVTLLLRPFASVATSREGRRPPRSRREGQHRQPDPGPLLGSGTVHRCLRWLPNWGRLPTPR
jgi:hypothetical protein